MADDIYRALVAALTPAQRDAIMRGSIGDHSMATVRALIRKGLMYLRISSPNGKAGFVENTELGNALRQHLRQANDRGHQGRG
jgi:hypothetical protein